MTRCISFIVLALLSIQIQFVHAVPPGDGRTVSTDYDPNGGGPYYPYGGGGNPPGGPMGPGWGPNGPSGPVKIHRIDWFDVNPEARVSGPINVNVIGKIPGLVGQATFNPPPPPAPYPVAQIEARNLEIRREIEVFQEKLNTYIAHSEKVDALVERGYKSLDRMSARFEQQASDYIRHELKMAQELGEKSVELASTDASPSTVKLVQDYAYDTAKSINNFLDGVGEGAYDGFLSTAEAMKVIYNNPELLTHLGENIMETISDPTEFMKSAKEGFTHYKTVILYGDAHQRGQVVGELGSHVLMGLATGEASVAGRAALEMIASKMSTKGLRSIGIHLAEKAAKAETLAAPLKVIEGEAAALDAATNRGVRGWRAHHKITEFKDAEVVNAALEARRPDYYGPFQDGTKVIDFKTTRKAGEPFCRVHTEENMEGPWMMKKEAILGLTPKEIQLKYSLPVPPTKMTDVIVPEGWGMSRGRVKDVLANVNRNNLPKDITIPEGAVQYRVHEHLPKSAFGEPRPIGNRVER